MQYVICAACHLCSLSFMQYVICAGFQDNSTITLSVFHFYCRNDRLHKWHTAKMTYCTNDNFFSCTSDILHSCQFTVKNNKETNKQNCRLTWTRAKWTATRPYCGSELRLCKIIKKTWSALPLYILNRISKFFWKKT